MSKNSNYGSIRKLNWRTPKFAEKVVKSSSIESNNYGRRFGSPPTRRGSYNGVIPSLKPAINFNTGPKLLLNKAILQPVKYGPGGAQFQRKRDASGKFAPAQNIGEQSTAEEDQIAQQRDARLRHHRILNKLRGKDGDEDTEKALPPGATTIDEPTSNVNDTNSQVIGQTTIGQPIYEDPFHSAHAQFSEQDHNEAASLHDAQAQQSQASGDAQGALKHSSAANAHRESAKQSMTPGSRFADNTLNNPDADISQFMDLLGVDQNAAAESPMDQQPPPMDPMAQPSMSNAPLNPMVPPSESMEQSPTGQNPPMDPMAGPQMSGGQQNSPGADSLDSFLNTDQNKPLKGTDLNGPAPGMIHTTTGGPVGPQTELPKADPIMDMLDQNAPQEVQAPSQQEDEGSSGLLPSLKEEDSPQPAPEPGGPVEAKDMDSPESHPGFPGPTSASNDDDEEKQQATMKAIKLLKRYL